MHSEDNRQILRRQYLIDLRLEQGDNVIYITSNLSFDRGFQPM